MSEAAIALTAALVGAVVSLLGTFLSRLHDKFAARVGAMEVVRSELNAALTKIRATLKSGSLWPEGYSLHSLAWESHCAELAPNLKTETWRDLQRRISLLESADRQADTVRGQDQARQDKFKAWLSDELQGELAEAIEILDDGLSYSRSRYRRGLTIVACLTAGLVIAGALIALPGGASTTTSSLAGELRESIPNAGHTVCEESADFDGAYQCAVEISTCHGQLEASTEAPACAQPKTVHVDVDTSDDCYFYEITGDLGHGRSPPKQPRGFVHAIADWVCKKR